MVVSGQTSLCLRKMLVLGKNGYSRPKVAVFRQKLLYLGEMITVMLIRQHYKKDKDYCDADTSAFQKGRGFSDADTSIFQEGQGSCDADTAIFQEGQRFPCR